MAIDLFETITLLKAVTLKVQLINILYSTNQYVINFQ